MSDKRGLANGRTLLVGTVEGGDGATRVGFGRLDAAVLGRLAPDRIICALFGRDHDAMQVAETLRALGWKGELIVFASGLPDINMVERELQENASGFTIRVVTQI